MGYFCKITTLHKRYFWVKHILENYLWDYIFLKSIVLWPYYIRLSMKKDIIFGNAYGEMHDLLAWKRVAYLIKFLRMAFFLIALFAKLKMLWYLGKLIQNLLDKKWVWRLWELCEYFGYFKSFCETTWNWTVFWFHVNCELFMFFLWAVACDYPMII